MPRSRRARRDPRPARAVAHQARGDQGGAQPADLRPGRLRTAVAISPRSKIASAQKLEEARMSASTSRASASRRPRRTCSASRRRWPAIPRSRPTTIRKVKQMLAARDEALLQPAPHHHRGAARRHRLQGAGAGQLRHRGRAGRSSWWPTPICGSRPTSRRPSSRACASGQPVTINVDTYPDMRMHRQGDVASPRRPARSSPCCRRRTPSATGSRWCSASRCASPSPAARAIRRCASA